MIGFTGFKPLRRVLCLGAHSDDVEIGAGATVLRILREAPNVEMKWVCFSGNEKRHDEARASADLFLKHAATKSLVLHSFTDTLFPAQHVEIKKQFEALKPFDPDLVLTHYRDDRHQDHRTISELTWNAFRSHQIWEYEIPKWDGDLIQPNLYVPVESDLLDAKLHGLMTAFGTQRAKHWFDEETFRGLARIRGLESNARYAEAFVARKFVVGT